MCFDELIGFFATNVSRLCYVRHNPDEGKISYALVDEPTVQHAVFADALERKKTWDATIVLLTRMCKPACIETGAHILFQPEFVTGLNRHADERAYFVIVLFPGKHNLALGSLTMTEREERYLMFCELLALNPSDGSPPPVLQ